MSGAPQRQQLALERTPLSSFAPAPSTVSYVPPTRNLSPADPFPCLCPGVDTHLGGNCCPFCYASHLKCSRTMVFRSSCHVSGFMCSKFMVFRLFCYALILKCSKDRIGRVGYLLIPNALMTLRSSFSIRCICFGAALYS